MITRNIDARKWRLLVMPALLLGFALYAGSAFANTLLGAPTSPPSPTSPTSATLPQHPSLDGWTQKAPYPIPIYNQACTTQAGMLLYCFGGTTTGDAVTAMAYKYSPMTNSWTRIADLPGARTGAAAVNDGIYIYVLNGSDGISGARSTLYRYDTYDDTYTTMVSAPLATYIHGAALLNGKIYRVGGQLDAGGMTNTVDVYDVGANSWAPAGTVANYPQTIAGLPLVVDNGYIYGIGGNFGMGAITKTYRYDPISNTWNDTAITDLPQNREGASAGLVEGNLIVAGGAVSGGNSASVLVVPSSNTAAPWAEVASLPRSPWSIAGYSMLPLNIPNEFYVVGGWDDNDPTQDNQVYTVLASTPVPTSTPVPPSPTTLPDTPTSTPVPPAPTPPPCGLAWRQMSSPDGPSDRNILKSVAAVSVSDMWTVGQYTDAEGYLRTLAEHWNGSGWSVVPSPNVGTGDNQLEDVVALSANNAWAVGYVSGPEPLVLHRDGGQWAVVPVSVPNRYGALRAVAAVSANDIWAVGLQYVGSVARTLTVHWNGTSWSAVTSPNATSFTNSLNDVTAFGGNSVWAVGVAYINAGQPRTLALRWNGTQWSIVPSPSPGEDEDLFASVGGSSPTDIWAVGYYMPSYLEQLGLFAHWNGTAWAVVPGPGSEQSGGYPQRVVVLSSTDAWALGSFVIQNGWVTKTYHWDGATWTASEDTSIDSYSRLIDIAAVAPYDLWGVGFRQRVGENEVHTLIKRYSNPNGFTDVLPNDPFYGFVTCLACHGVLGGYSDGTFRPGNNITRGQIAKVVSNAADFQDDVTGRQTYTDVPATQTFWLWIERLTLHQVMSGYNCGGIGEPCDAQQRPYFRWGANATRGQLAKIVSNAANDQTPVPSTQQTFEDVAYTNTFWLWIERLAQRGVMGGYTCGTPPAGQCVPPRNRAYFLPFNNVTRGQASKIVANTFYPNCQVPSKR